METPAPPVLRKKHIGKETPASVRPHSARAAFPSTQESVPTIQTMLARCWLADVLADELKPNGS
jgi:hypothetical protein